jgi:N utilization substance protein B
MSPESGHGRRFGARAHALQALYWRQFVDGELNKDERGWIVGGAQPFDRPYFEQLILGVESHAAELDGLYEPFLDRPAAQIDPVEKAILRLGCYELRFHRDVDVPVVLDESVELAKQYGAGESYRFINGVLDQVARKLRGSLEGHGDG